MIITLDHARRMGYCSSGIRLFAKKYKLDLREFCHNGIDESVLISTGDEMAIAIVEEAKKWGVVAEKVKQ